MNFMRPALLFLLALPIFASWHVMPVPSSIKAGTRVLPITSSFRIELTDYTESRLEAAAARMTRRIAKLTGLPIVPSSTALIVNVKAASQPVQTLDEDETYQLTVNATGAMLTAANPLGALHGLETFYQLIDNTPTGWAAASATIDDHPRFPWRGFMLDVSRHFMPLDVVRRNLDAMAAVKLNVFHWHLSDDQGFRVESEAFPKLHQLGSDGLYYTQDEIRGIVAYAHERGIRVVPEFGWLAIPNWPPDRVPTKSAGTGAFSIPRSIPLTQNSMISSTPS
jgi:hexosaminidase